MSHIFISYAAEDSSVALKIASGIEAAGFPTWVYERDSVPGPAYLIQMGEAIDEAQALMLIISLNSIGSNQVTSEVVRAHESGKPFIPLMYGISHDEFQQRQPLWRQVLGAATSIEITEADISQFVPRIVEGVNALRIRPDAAAQLGPRQRDAVAARRDAGDGERRQLTVMFCELVDFTLLSEQLDMEELRWSRASA